MKRFVVVLSLFVLASIAAPSAFAVCHDCPDGFNCIAITGGARFCEFFVDGHCEGVGTCPTAAASLQAEYRVAAVRVIEPGAKQLPAPASHPASWIVLTARSSK